MTKLATNLPNINTRLVVSVLQDERRQSLLK